MENEVLRYTLCLVFVFAVGVMAWAIDSKIRGPRPPSEPETVVEWRSQVLGWISAVLFRTSSAVIDFAFRSTHPDSASVGARIPQIRGWFRCLSEPSAHAHISQ